MGWDGIGGFVLEVKADAAGEVLEGLEVRVEIRVEREMLVVRSEMVKRGPAW